MGGTQVLEYGPGIGAFVAFFLVAVALWLLMRSMYSRMRNVRFDEAAEDERRVREAGDDVVTRPRRQLFLPVRDDRADGSALDAQPVSDARPRQDEAVHGVDGAVEAVEPAEISDGEGREKRA